MIYNWKNWYSMVLRESLKHIKFIVADTLFLQCPPFRLSYQGLGEPLCFAAFGPFATTAFYLSQSGKTLAGLANNNVTYCSVILCVWTLAEHYGLHFAREPCLPVSRTVLSASFLVGLTTTLILFCSHFHQVYNLVRMCISFLFLENSFPYCIIQSQIDSDRAVGKMSPLV